jgi:hypothetical protein
LRDAEKAVRRDARRANRAVFRSLLMYACVLESCSVGEYLMDSRHLLGELEFDIGVQRLIASELRRDAEAARRVAAEAERPPR